MLGVSVRGLRLWLLRVSDRRLWLLRVYVGLLRLPVRRLILILRRRRRHAWKSPLLSVGR